MIHYRAHGTPIGKDGSQRYAPQCRAAMITETSNDTGVVSLVVFNPTGLFFREHVELDDTDFTGGTWHWPPSTPELALTHRRADPE